MMSVYLSDSGWKHEKIRKLEKNENLRQLSYFHIGKWKYLVYHHKHLHIYTWQTMAHAKKETTKLKSIITAVATYLKIIGKIESTL